jgi:hypothetical protein
MNWSARRSGAWRPAPWSSPACRDGRGQSAGCLLGSGTSHQHPGDCRGTIALVVATGGYDTIMRSITAPFEVPPACRHAGADPAAAQSSGCCRAWHGRRVLGRVASGDLARRCALGPGTDGRTDRKRELTALSSSRWAGAITRTSNDQWQRGWRNLLDARAGLGRSGVPSSGVGSKGLDEVAAHIEAATVRWSARPRQWFSRTDTTPRWPLTSLHCWRFWTH